ncbi:hypothetical protein [Thermococcus thioreducens]|uniref:Uncharacterized protein n=1 Tax=Thermococcus thioreducens TaxID=277988 RepID=A0A0Q2M3M2_9EURY|nr:hypothetical protein [Thermococcus thioreducens]ASJ12111.1 hypothetical protein A3L14_04100 [Thermococcus thioreducens]KQH82673.1 hypothetical protein AMR53_03465 [Thermococcus thioreducens]SEW08157.1 hypothetical protein SAMN05216170_1450 [Thermococcus thioreducens]
MDVIHLIFLIPILGLMAYPDWKRVLQLSFAFSLLSLEVLTLSKSFEVPLIGLGFGILSFGIPYSLIRTQNKKSKRSPSDHIIVLLVWFIGVSYMVIRGDAKDSTTVLKVASIALLDGIGIISLHQGAKRISVTLTLLGLWILIVTIRDHGALILGVITTLLYIAHYQH